MSHEIERKFLVASDAWRAQAGEPERILQGYLARAERASVRVRVSGERAWINVKGATVGISRAEFEYPVPVDDARTMLRDLCVGGRIEKTRHRVEHRGHVWEIDVFSGDNAGLIVAEIELGSEDERFERPPWVGAEVSSDTRYYNSMLAEHPYRDWGVGPGAGGG